MPRSRLLGVLAVLGLFLGGGCYQPPADIATAEVLLGISDAMDDLRNENAILQEQIDSLYVRVVRQDSLMRSMAARMGMDVPR